MHIWNAFALYYCYDYSFKSLSLDVNSAYYICWFYFSVLTFLKILIIHEFGLLFCGRIIVCNWRLLWSFLFAFHFRYFLQLLFNRELSLWLNMIINLSIKMQIFYKLLSEIHNCGFEFFLKSQGEDCVILLLHTWLRFNYFTYFFLLNIICPAL